MVVMSCYSPLAIKIINMRTGDIFEIHTPEGKAYLQYITTDDVSGELVRVLNGTFLQTPKSEELEKLVIARKRFKVHFPLKAAQRKGIVHKVGHSESGDLSKPQYMRAKKVVRGELHGWHIVETTTGKRELVDSLSEEQIKLSPWGVWNDTLLIERISKGWSLERWD